ncbi:MULTISPECIES: hypothetical protein [Streptomyces]|uniref:hypothetical protein n=1 Tax=Streptomyces TaxID=1883 RepID=UPI001CB78A3C|nr:hypothetical protein [Streptomyces xanthii]
MTSAPLVAAVTRAASPELLGLFLVGALVAICCGLNWALDLRGTLGRRTGAPPVAVPSPGHLRLLGSLLTAAGVVLLCVTYVLWRLG